MDWTAERRWHSNRGYVSAMPNRPIQEPDGAAVECRFDAQLRVTQRELIARMNPLRPESYSGPLRSAEIASRDPSRRAPEAIERYWSTRRRTLAAKPACSYGSES